VLEISRRQHMPAKKLMMNLPVASQIPPGAIGLGSNQMTLLSRLTKSSRDKPRVQQEGHGSSIITRTCVRVRDP
jgi:hypothetical protein